MRKGLSEIEEQIILAMYDCGMHVQSVADKLHYAIGTIYYHIRKIHSITGLNPMGYFELCELVKMVKKTGGNNG